MFWLTPIMILERIVVKMMLMTKVRIKRPASINNCCLSLLGMALSRASCVSFGENNAMMPPMALRISAKIIFPTYFLTYTEARSRCRNSNGVSRISSSL